MESHTRRKAQCPPVFRNPIWKLKYEQDQTKLRSKLQRQLSNDFLRLYEESCSVDLQLKTQKKDIFCHSFIIESRCLPLWSLIIQLARLQRRKPIHESNLIISVPAVDYFSLDCFIRSLYTDDINEALWPTLKLQIETSFPAPKPSTKPFVIQSLDTQEEKQLEILIAEQIKKGKFSLRKSNLKSNAFDDYELPCMSGHATGRRRGTLNYDRPADELTPIHQAITGMTSEQETTNCNPEEVRPKEKASREDMAGGRSRSKRASRSSESRTKRKLELSAMDDDRRQNREALSEDALFVHNAAEDSLANIETSSLEVELESSVDGQISTPESNQGRSSKCSDEPPIQVLTRTRTFEIITPLTRSTVFSDDQSESSARVTNGHSPEDNCDRVKATERRKGSLIFNNNIQTYSNIPTSNLMTMSSDAALMSNQADFACDSLTSSFHSTKQKRRSTTPSDGRSISDIRSRKAKLLSKPREVESPSPDSLCVEDSRIPRKEMYDSEEKERDDSESFQNLPSITASITELQDQRLGDEVLEDSPRRPRQTSASSVRDIDDIPVICGYAAQESDAMTHESSSDISGKGQSIFSMFIDLNEIPSPKKKPKVKKDPKTQQGVYMFIDAGSSPKLNKTSNGDLEKPIGPKQDSNDMFSYCKEKSPNPTDCPVKETSTKATPNKGFYMFIDVDSNSSSPKPRRRFSSQNRSCNKENLMSKSAPTDSHLFKGRSPSSKSLTPINNVKMMTKSVIDRDEFMSQPPARRNVSLNEKINESSKIPRPIANFKQRIKFSSSASCKKKTKDDMAFLNELNEKVESEFEDLNRVNGISISEDISSVSDVSSLLNSIGRVSDRRNSHCLGDDLLRLFEKEINTDVTLQVGERKIRAHKCILASRCVYFAAVLSGHWVENSGNIIKLQGYSPEAVIVALKHIYSGKSTVPPGVKAVELAALSDMLCLDGMKEVVSLHLKANQCHYFHKPCADCLIGVLEVLPIAGAYYLDDLFRRCLKWISKHFAIVLPTRGFATLPEELQERCIKQIIDDISVTSAIDTAMGCDRVLCLLPAVKWAHDIIDLAGHLFDMVKNFISSNFSSVLSSDRFVSMNSDGNWSIDKMEEALLLCCSQMKLDEAISTFIKLSNVFNTVGDEGITFTDVYLSMLKRLLDRTEKMLIANANRVSVCRKWPLLPPQMQAKIKNSSVILLDTGRPLSAKPKLSSINRVRGSSIEPVVRSRASSMCDSKLARSASTTVVPNQTPSHGRKLKATSERCHTPPAPLMRSSLQTPLSNKTSMLRAQAAIQRSQSTRSVSERPKKVLSSQFCNANIEDKHNMNLKNGALTTHLDRSRPSTRCSALSTSQTQQYGSRPETPHKQLCHKRNYSGSLTHVQKNFENDGNFGSKRLVSPATLTNCNASVIPKLRTQLPVIQRQKVMSSSVNESQLRRSNLDQFEDSDRSYEDNITPPKIQPSLARSGTFSKD